MGQSAGAINVYALLTSPLMVEAQPAAVPPRGAAERRHLAGEQPAAGQPPDAARRRRPTWRRATRCCCNLLIADGMARRRGRGRGLRRHADAGADRRLPARARSPTTLLTTLLHASWRRSASPARARSPTARCCRPIRSPRSRPATTCKVPVLAGNTRDEAKLFPTFLRAVAGARRRQRPAASTRRDAVRHRSSATTPTRRRTITRRAVDPRARTCR